MSIQEIRHPLIRHKLGLLRRSDISTKNFRELAQEVTMLLTYEQQRIFLLLIMKLMGGQGKSQLNVSQGRKSPSYRFCVQVSGCLKAFLV